MSLPSKTLAAIVRRGEAIFRSAFPDLPMGTKRFLGRSSRAISRNIWGLHKSIEDIDADIVPSSKSSDDILSEWAALLGLPDGEGGYGRLKPTAASGGEATLTGVLGTDYPDELIAVAEDGTTEIMLSGEVAIAGASPGFGSITGAKFIAITKGSVGNLPVGTKCTWQNPPAGADASFILTSELSDGHDTEDNPAVFGRIVARLQTPPRGGVAEDYRLWAEVSGVLMIYVYPLRSGTGTVDVVIVGGGTGVNRVPTDTTRVLAQDAVDIARPRGSAGANVIVPSTASSGHLVRLRVSPSLEKYDFDFDDTAGALTVDAGGYSAGPPATLRLNTIAPLSLKSAIDAYKMATGDAPRLQVISTGVVINAPIRAVDYADAGGKTTLTLEAVTAAWTPPANGDSVYAYGPVVATIAAGIKALCDSLGPSRESGFADDLTFWPDKLTISGLIGIAETAIDTDGTKLISEVLAGGATIDGAGVDVQGADATNAGPEILYLSHVAVTQ